MQTCGQEHMEEGGRDISGIRADIIHVKRTIIYRLDCCCIISCI